MQKENTFNAKDPWEILSNLGEDAVEGRLINPSINTDYYLYKKHPINPAINKRKLKILPLPKWISIPSYTTTKDLIQAPIIFRKENWYLSQDYCWLEVHAKGNWKAFLGDKITFIKELEQRNIWQQYNQKQIKALKRCQLENVSTKKQNYILSEWLFYKECLELKRDSFKIKRRLKLK